MRGHVERCHLFMYEGMTGEMLQVCVIFSTFLLLL